MCAAKNDPYPAHHRRRVARPAHPLSGSGRHPADAGPGPGDPVQLADGPGAEAAAASTSSPAAVRWGSKRYRGARRMRPSSSGNAGTSRTCAKPRHCSRPRDRPSSRPTQSTGWQARRSRSTSCSWIRRSRPDCSRKRCASWKRAAGWRRMPSSTWSCPAKAGAPALPAGWLPHRSGRAGAVGYHLARRQGEGAAT